MENELVKVAMDMILKAGDARLYIQKALQDMETQQQEHALAHMKEAELHLRDAHRSQTRVIQNEAAGNVYEYSMLFAHAQDTLMSVNSEFNLTTQLIQIFTKLDQRYQRIEVTNG